MNLLKLSFKLIVFLSSINVFAGFNVEEYIKSFISDIEITQDGTINIIETISVVVAGRGIKYGIYREFPTRYKDRFGSFVTVGFELLEAFIDSENIDPEIILTDFGYKIIVKNPELLSYGLHTFIIKYKTDRQLGFFNNSQDNFVEFYFNITGNSWKFPILYACANISLPKDLPLNLVNIYAYTGKINGKDYKYNIINNIIKMETTRSIDIGSGFTVALNWPHGYIVEPALKSKIINFAKDNSLVVLLFLYLLFLIALLIYFYTKKYINSKKYTVIPIYNLPENLTPAAVRFILMQHLDSIAIASNVVYLAVHSFLTIDYKKSFISGGYSLTRLDKNISVNLPGNLKYILDHIFSKASTVRLPLSANMSNALVSSVEKSLKLSFSQYFCDIHKNIIFVGAAVISLIFYYAIRWVYDFALALFVGFFLLVLCLVVYFLLKDFTDEGLKLKAQIDGFKMFLSATQEEFLKIVGSTPEQNPELYEKYLPYAMALGVEKQWNLKFAPYFKMQESQKHFVNPYWQLSNSRFGFNKSFRSNFSKQFPAATGSFPGSSGRGRSGGGGGGGGGGGC